MRSHRILAILGIVVLASVLLSADGGEAAPPAPGPEAAGSAFQRIELVGDAVDLSTGATTQRLSPSVAYNSAHNEYMAVWFDTRNANNNDVFGQRVSATGAPMGSNFPLIQFAEAQVDPVVSYNSADNRYLVAWQTQQAGFFNQARGRRISSDGTHLGPDFFITTGGLELSSTYNPTANEWFVTGRAFPGSGIRGRRVMTDGSLAGSEVVISPGGAPNGQVAHNPNANEYLATWTNQTAMSLQGQRASAAGALLGGPSTISPLLPGGDPPAGVAFDSTNNRYLVAFSPAGEDRIVGQLVASSGLLLDSAFTIASDIDYPGDPYIAYSPINGAFLMVYREMDNIVGRLLSEGGAPMGGPVTIAVGTASRDPVLAHNSLTGEFLVAWPDDRNVPLGEQDIFAQVVRLAPVPHGDADCNGVVDAVDAALVLQFSAGLIGMGLCLPAADVSPDGTINAVDAALILQHTAGLIPNLPP